MAKKSNQLLMQASILAMAGFICRIIGFIYRIPLTNIIGDLGNGYYGYAFVIYSVVLMITTYSIPGTVAKIMAERIATREYKNAQRVFHCALIYICILAGTASLVTCFIVPFFVKKNTAMVLRVFCPTIFLSGVLGVFRGYFQAHRTMVQSSMSQIFEQIVNAAVSITMALVFVNLAAGKDADTVAVYGAMGSAMGTGAGVLTALLFMMAVYRLNKGGIKRKMLRDTTTELESYRTIFALIFGLATPVIMSTLIYNLNTMINTSVFKTVTEWVGTYTADEATSLYGVFSGKAVVLINVPIAIASAVAATLLPNVAANYAVYGEERTAKDVNDSLKMLMIVVIPITVGMFIFCDPIMKFMYPRAGEWEMGAKLLRILSFDVVFISISTMSNAVLQALGHPQRTVVNATIALVLQTILLVGMLVGTSLGVYAIAIATVAYAVIMCVLNRRAVLKCLPYKQNLTDTYLRPMTASLIMGAVSSTFYIVLYTANIFKPIFHQNNRIIFSITVLVAIVVYFASIIKIGGVSESEMEHFPKGTALVRVSKKLRLL